ncbi:MAG: hypothetical protein H0T72_01535, partial [Chloroflexia bacterium]|nr:hypothetical protein [Chloroflexia bacterium]
MTRLADLDLTIIPQTPPIRVVGDSRPAVTLAYSISGNKRSLSLSKAAVRAVGQPEYIQVAVAGPYLVVRACAPTDDGARKLDKQGATRATEMSDRYGLKVGERFRFDVEIEDGNLICHVP